jgi:hypothetical protein
VNTSWCASIYHALRTLNLLAFWPDCSRVSALDWNKLCLETIRAADFANLLINCNATQAGRRYAQLKTKPGFEKYLLRHDRNSMLIKFWLRASCFGLRARTEHGDNAEDKKCKLCALDEHETERHFLLECEAFDSERTDFWNQLDIAVGAIDYVDSEFLHPRKSFLDASPDQCLAYLLGVTHPRWPKQAEEVINQALRPLLVSLVARRAGLLGASCVDSSLDPSDDESNNEDTN